jgi:hypothetical protein
MKHVRTKWPLRVECTTAENSSRSLNVSRLRLNVELNIEAGNFLRLVRIHLLLMTSFKRKPISAVDGDSLQFINFALREEHVCARRLAVSSAFSFAAFWVSLFYDTACKRFLRGSFPAAHQFPLGLLVAQPNTLRSLVPSTIVVWHKDSPFWLPHLTKSTPSSKWYNYKRSHD